MIIYKDNIFAVEYKSWKGKVVIDGENIHHIKNNTEEKVEKNPVLQINRAVSILKNEIGYKGWINADVFIEGDNPPTIIHDNDMVFYQIESFIDYIKNCNAHQNYYNQIFPIDRLNCCDTIMGNSTIKGKITTKSIVLFDENNVCKEVLLSDLSSLSVKRKSITDDYVEIVKKNGIQKKYSYKGIIKIEISVYDEKHFVALNKIAGIEFGN